MGGTLPVNIFFELRYFQGGGCEIFGGGGLRNFRGVVDIFSGGFEI